MMRFTSCLALALCAVGLLKAMATVGITQILISREDALGF